MHLHKRPGCYRFRTLITPTVCEGGRKHPLRYTSVDGPYRLKISVYGGACGRADESACALENPSPRSPVRDSLFRTRSRECRGCTDASLVKVRVENWAISGHMDRVWDASWSAVVMARKPWVFGRADWSLCMPDAKTWLIIKHTFIFCVHVRVRCFMIHV